METPNILPESQQPSEEYLQACYEAELQKSSASEDDYTMPADAVNLLEGVPPIYAMRFTPKKYLDRPCPLAAGVYEIGFCFDYTYPYVCGYFGLRLPENASTLNDLVARVCAWFDEEDYPYLDRLYYSPSSRRLIAFELSREALLARRETDNSDFR